jgi:hypothetical protein
MQKKIFYLLILLLSIFFTNNIYAYKEGDNGEKITCKGKLTRVYMNGEKTAGQPVTAIITKKADGVYTVELKEFKVGKMPGSISVLANNVTIAQDGTFNMPSMNKIIILRLFNLYDKKFDANLYGRLKNGEKLYFTIESVNATFWGIPFKAIATFEEN